MAPTYFGVVGILLAWAFYAAQVDGQGQVIPPTCHKGVQVVAVPGQGVPNGTYGLSGNLMNVIYNAIPDSSYFTFDYDRFPLNGDINTYFNSEVSTAAVQLSVALANYVAVCPNTPIVVHGYSEGGVAVAEMLCGSTLWGYNLSPLNPSFTSHIISVILYGEESWTSSESFALGGCPSSSPSNPRRNVAACAPFAPLIQSYCWPDDNLCCSTADTTVATPNGQPWHWEYPYFDTVSTNFVVNRYNNFINGRPQTQLAPPSNRANVGNYVYQGCYIDKYSPRPLTTSELDSSTLTIEQCATFCSGHLMFGVEFTGQCFCGDSLTAGTLPAPATDCAMACGGDLSEICGGPLRMNIYSSVAAPQATSTAIRSSSTTFVTIATKASTTSNAVPTSTNVNTATATATSTAAASSLPSGIVSLGCYVDSSTRALPVNLYTNSSNSNSLCALACRAQGYPFSGTEYGQECYCGPSLPTNPAPSASDCNMACAGNPAQTCGAGWRLSVQQDTTLLSASNLPSGIQRVGCYIDSSTRTFPVQIYSSSTNTPATCAVACRNLGYTFSGTEYGQECWCGYSAPPASLAATPTDCNQGCTGDSTQTCGAGWRLSIVQDTNSQALIVDPAANGYTLLGCYQDSSTRTLGNPVNGGGSSMTVRTCLTACKAAGYSYCGVEYGQECYGSNSAPSSSLLTAGLAGDMLNAGGCGQPCAGNSSESCGAGWRIVVYSSAS